MKRLTLDLPTELVEAYGGEQAARAALTELAVVDLVRRGGLPVPTGAQLLKLSLPEFIQRLAATTPVPKKSVRLSGRRSV